MTIIIKDVPGLTDREVLEVLMDITTSPIATGHGGFVVDEDIAEQFLTAYLIVSGKRPPHATVPTTTVPVVETVENDAPTEPVPARTTARRAGRRKEAA